MFGRKKNKVEVKPEVAEATGIPEEIVAVITAAIEASLGRVATTSLIIKKIDRKAGVIPAWRTASIADQIESRY
jgi:hypothetical protein